MSMSEERKSAGIFAQGKGVNSMGEQMLNCQVNELKINSLSKDIEYMDDRLKEFHTEIQMMQQAQIRLENFNTRVDTILKTFEDRFENIEVGLKEIVAELKTIGNQLVLGMATVEHQTSKEAGFVNKLMDSNNRVLFLVIMVLCASVLFLLGINAEEIVKILIPTV